MTNNWIPLTEYSNKYKVSISTLRRRIRSDRAEYKYEEGRYLLKDTMLADHNPNYVKESRKVSAPPQTKTISATEKNEVLQEKLHDLSEKDDKSPVLATAHKLLDELKKAYMVVLQEKEEQVMILKDEVADLQTLVRVLEAENNRLKQKPVQKASGPKEKNPVFERNWVHTLEIE